MLGRHSPRSPGLRVGRDTLEAVTEEPALAGRSYANVYRVTQRADLHARTRPARRMAER